MYGITKAAGELAARHRAAALRRAHQLGVRRRPQLRAHHAAGWRRPRTELTRRRRPGRPADVRRRPGRARSSRLLDGDLPPGTYHAHRRRPVVSWAGFARRGARGHRLPGGAGDDRAVPRDARPRRAPRPANSALAAGPLQLRDWREALAEYLERGARVKGIVLAGGSGTRLYPLTQAVSKQLLPVYDKPMIHYPLSTLMLAGHPRHPHHHDAARPGAVRPAARATARSTAARSPTPCSPSRTAWPRRSCSARDFVGGDKVALVLGDNIFYGPGFGEQLHRYTDVDGGAIFAYHVADPERYGVVEFDAAAAGGVAGGEAGDAAQQLRRRRAVLLRQRRPRDRPRHRAQRPRRARDHRRSTTPTSRRAGCRSP